MKLFIFIVTLAFSSSLYAACTSEDLKKLRESGMPLEDIKRICQIGNRVEAPKETRDSGSDLARRQQCIDKNTRQLEDGYRDCKNRTDEDYQYEIESCQDEYDDCMDDWSEVGGTSMARYFSDPQECMEDANDCAIEPGRIRDDDLDYCQELYEKGVNLIRTSPASICP